MVGAIAIPLPWLYVLLKRHQRLDRLREQLPDAFELMSRVLRAGQTISQAMQAVAEEFSRPISLEFLYCSEQMNLGLSPEQALRILGQRTGLLEIKIFILSVVVHRNTGGNLAELLDKLSFGRARAVSHSRHDPKFDGTGQVPRGHSVGIALVHVRAVDAD